MEWFDDGQFIRRFGHYNRTKLLTPFIIALLLLLHNDNVLAFILKLYLFYYRLLSSSCSLL